MKQSVILTDRLGPDILLVLTMKRQVLHREQFHRQSSLQTSQKDKNDRIPFTLTFHPRNHAVKSIILNNFKLLQNDPETGRIFSQAPLISFKRDKKVGNFQMRALTIKPNFWILLLWLAK